MQNDAPPRMRHYSLSAYSKWRRSFTPPFDLDASFRMAHQNGSTQTYERRSELSKAQLNCSVGVVLSVFCAIIATPFPGMAAQPQERPGAPQGSAEPAEAFEAASVKLVPKTILDASHGPVTAPFRGFRYTPGRVTCVLPLRSLVREAYSVQGWQVIGPNYMDGDFYELAAVMPKDTKRNDARLMLQTLLKDRFGLRVHWERKIISVYVLVIDKVGFKLKEVEPTAYFEYGSKGPGRFSATAMPFSNLASVLTGQLDRPVIDRTAIKGSYTFELNLTPEEDGAQLGIISALKEQLGLKLEPRKEPYPMLVVDHVEKIPTVN